MRPIRGFALVLTAASGLQSNGAHEPCARPELPDVAIRLVEAANAGADERETIVRQPVHASLDVDGVLDLPQPADADTVDAATRDTAPRVPALDGLALDASMSPRALERWYSHAETDVLVRFEFRLQRLAEALTIRPRDRCARLRWIEAGSVAADLAAVEKRLQTAPRPSWLLEGLATHVDDTTERFETRYVGRNSEELFLEAWRVNRAKQAELERAFDERFARGCYVVLRESATVG